MIEEYVEYRDGGLYWKKNRGTRGVKGRRVGTPRKDGYHGFKFDGTYYREHQIIWKLHHGDVPDGLCIDHINRDKSDNRIENLRLLSNAENCLNNDAKGYYRKDGRFAAQIRRFGKTIHLGYFDNEEDARSAYLEAKGAYV